MKLAAILVVLLAASTARAEADEPKSPLAAGGISVSTTLLGGVILVSSFGTTSWGVFWTGAGMMAVGPTLGHVYAGDYWNTTLGVKVGALGLGLAGIAVSPPRYVERQVSSTRKDIGEAMLAVGALTFIGASLVEIGTAPGAAREYNRAHAARTNVVPLVTPGAAGLSLAGTF